MKLNIEQIREILKDNNYLADKTINISEIKTGRQYLFTCQNGHTFESNVSNAFQSGKFGCPICSGRRVLKGFNDLWTTHPELASMLKNKDDGYRYNAGSNVKLLWICPDCGNERLISPNKMTTQKHYCTVCNNDKSYPEKFISNLLNQFCIHFEKEKMFYWSNNKRYDFYIPIHNCIIEVHGKQHYSNSDFSYLSGRTFAEEQYNDDDKEFYAKEFGNVSNYIIIDCRKSEINWIKRSVIESGLLEILQIIPDSIDWEECHHFALNNLTKLVCEMYENGEDINVICKATNLSHNSVITKLKNGAKIGWCTYDPNEKRKKVHKENGQRIINTMSKSVVQMDMSYNVIKEFSSIQEAQRQLSISHIWDCIVGRRNSAGGYKWRYKDDIN